MIFQFYPELEGSVQAVLKIQCQRDATSFKPKLENQGVKYLQNQHHLKFERNVLP